MASPYPYFHNIIKHRFCYGPLPGQGGHLSSRIIAMLPMQKKICLVIPCYNEEKRLDISQFREALGGAYFLFVNDGSIDETLSFLEANQMEGMCILNLDRNCGKGEAVRRG